MTASSTPCSPRRSDRRPLGSSWLAGLCLAVACLLGDAHAGGIELRDFALSPSEEGYEVNATMEFEIPLALENLVERGVILSFKADIEIFRPRWYWFDERVARKAQTVRLSYHALTRQYRVAIGDLQQSFPTLQDAVRQLSRLHSWLVAERKDLKPGVAHRVSFRYFLDTTELPKPLQVTAFTSSGWDLSAPIVQVSYTPGAEGK
jgi:hypothetical protein